MDVIEEFKCMGKFTKKNWGGGSGGRGGWIRGGVGLVWGAQGGCERRIEVFVKIKKKIIGGGGRGWVQGGCERGIEVFWKIHKKKNSEGGGGGGQVGGLVGGGSGWM